VTGHLDPEAFAGLTGDRRAEAVRHLSRCAACRLSLAEHDPTALFALLGSVPMSPTLLEAATPRARDLDTEGGKVAPIGRAPRWVAMAASLTLAALLGVAAFRSRPAPGILATMPPPLDAPTPRARVALVSSPGTPRVVDLTVGETQVVMIFDSRLSL